VRQGKDVLCERGQVVQVDTRFVEFGGEADFDEDRKPGWRSDIALVTGAKFGVGTVKFLRQGNAVHGVNSVKQASGAAGFVALQMADEMPGGIEVGDLRKLPFPLLHAILAKVPDAGRISFANVLRGKGFRNRDERNFVWIPTCARGGAGDALADGSEV